MEQFSKSTRNQKNHPSQPQDSTLLVSRERPHVKGNLGAPAVRNLECRLCHDGEGMVWAPLLICAACGEPIKYGEGESQGLVSWRIGDDGKQASEIIFTHKLLTSCNDLTHGWMWVDLDQWLANLVFNTGLDPQRGASGGKNDGWFQDRFHARKADKAEGD